MKILLKKYSVVLSLLLLQTVYLFGKQANKVATNDAGDWALEHIFLILGCMVITGAIWSMVSSFEAVVDYEKRKLLKAQGIAIPEPVAQIEAEASSFWKDLYDKAWNLVPTEKEEDILFDHEYDGIRELDNDLPPWWLALFWIGLVSGVAYYSYYHILDYGESSRAAYATEMAYADRQVKAFLALQPDQVDENNVTLLEEENDLMFGNTIYVANCAACHGQVGEGGIGPNLTDAYWIHGGSITDVFKSIKYGVPSKGMIAWKSQFRSADIQKVASYIMTLQGSNPPKAKEPQGELYEPTQEEAASIGMKLN